MQKKQINEMFESPKNLELPKDNFAVFGGGSLIVRGIIPGTNDIDVFCSGDAWTMVKETGTLHYNDDYDVEIVTLFDAQLSFGNKWGTGNFDVDYLIDGAEYIDELPFVKKKHVVEYKLQRASAKDMLHFEAPRPSNFFALVGKKD